MRILVNFDHYDGAFSLHCIGPDQRTRVSPWLTVKSAELLLRIFDAINPLESRESIQHAIRAWGRSSIRCEPDAAGLKLLRINA